MMRNRFNRLVTISLLWCWLIYPTTGVSEDAVDARLADEFTQNIHPFIKQYCLDCHGPDEPKAKFDISGFRSLDDIIAGHRHWELILEKLLEREMPPEKADAHPSEAAVLEVIDWIQTVRKHEALKNAGDPGLVSARRLSNAEYNYTVRDLTGVDIQPTKEFPVDAANQAGFDNSGESLSLSPGLLNKYLQAARTITEHLILKPDGLAWSDHAVVTETDRDKYTVLRIIDFYQRQPTDLADYFYAAWEQAHAEEPRSIEATAATANVSPNYLQVIWETLNAPAEPVGPIAKIQTMWRALSPADESNEVRARCEAIRDYIKTIRRQLEPHVNNLEARGVHRGSQPFVLWKNRQYSANRRAYDPAALMTQTQIDAKVEANKRAIEKAKKEQEENKRSRNRVEEYTPPHADLILPEDPSTHDAYHAAFARFAIIFPDAFYISERGRDYVGVAREKQEKGRLLSAGFHSMMGYYRDDKPLYDMILDEVSQRELDALWDELDFISFAPKRQYQGFLWFERTDSRYMTDEIFDFARPEDKDATSEGKILRLAEVYLEKAERNGATEIPMRAIAEYFEGANDRIRWLERTHADAEPSHLRDMLIFAWRAFRRPLTTGEQEELLAFYHSMRAEGGLSHEDALRDSFVSILISPHFFYRVDLVANRKGISPLSDYALANRLSYFLWSSMPDDELLSLAAAGRLQEPDVMANQARRMLRDDRVRALAVEFGANWLDFRRFEHHNAVDRGRFPQFDNALRQAMFEEPIRFMVDVFQNNRSVRELLYGDHTLVNRTLAQHYEFPLDDLAEDTWVRFDDAATYGRGGLLPMATFLTMNAPGLRTSPVKRGYWVARRVLGEVIPPPPPDVPEIPGDETQLGDLTLAEVLARHREHENCSGCHERFDSLGIVFENYGPIGERRTLDLGNRPVSIEAIFPGGSKGSGLSALKEYLQREREPEFHENICRKLLAYALGRSLILSDDPLIEEMLAKLEENGYGFSVLVESIVTSQQFLTKRSQTILARN